MCKHYRGTIVMQTTMVTFLSRDWGVYPKRTADD